MISLRPAVASTTAARQADRIGVLDVLRGIALFGMFLVHFSDSSSDGAGLIMGPHGALFVR